MLMLNAFEFFFRHELQRLPLERTESLRLDAFGSGGDRMGVAPHQLGHRVFAFYPRSFDPQKSAPPAPGCGNKTPRSCPKAAVRRADSSFRLRYRPLFHASADQRIGEGIEKLFLGAEISVRCAGDKAGVRGGFADRRAMKTFFKKLLSRAGKDWLFPRGV